MSYALRLADEAKQGLAALPFEVQEAVIDFLDELTDEARMKARPRTTSRNEVFDLETSWGGRRYWVFTVVTFEHWTQTVRVKSVKHAARG